MVTITTDFTTTTSILLDSIISYVKKNCSRYKLF